MKLLNPEEHQSCFNYETGDRPGIEYIEIPAEGMRTIDGSGNKLLFVIGGSIRYYTHEHPDISIDSDNFLFMPAETVAECGAQRCARLLMVRLEGPIRFCECYFVEKLHHDVQGETEGPGQPGPYIARVHPVLKEYLTALACRLSDGLRCRNFFELKVKELFYLLRAYYTKKELSRIFDRCLVTDSAFTERINAIYHLYPTVSQLAAAMNYTLKGFEKKFKKVYGIPPYQWLKQQKMAKLHRELTTSEKNLKTIAIEFGFAGPPQLNDFCKKNFNLTPGKLRELSKKSV